MSETNNPSVRKVPIFPLKFWFVCELILCACSKSGMGFFLVLFEYSNSLFAFKKCYNRIVQDMFEQLASKLKIRLLTIQIPVPGNVISLIIQFVDVFVILVNQVIIKAEEMGYLNQKRGWIQVFRYSLLIYHTYFLISWMWK